MFLEFGSKKHNFTSDLTHEKATNTIHHIISTGLKTTDL